jgi:NADPH:quinone reductase-like Zn-dependent oxidoreductase
MKAVVLHEYGGPDTLKYEDVPDPVAGEGQVLVRVTAASINPIDWKMRSGVLKAFFPVTFPGILGRDLSGVIRAVGPGVEGFEPGDHVFALANQTYAELCVAPANLLAKIPDGMDLAEAAALPLVLLTGEQLIRVGTQLEPGQTVLITGAVGGVGRAAVWTAKDLGAHVIAGVRRKQVEAAASLGADEVLALDDKQAMSKLGLVDAVADAVGGELGELLLGKVKPGGIFATVVGDPKNKGLHPTVRVEMVRCQPDPEQLLRLTLAVKAGTLVIPIDRMLPLAEAGAGQAAAERGGIGKVLLLA